MSVVPLSELGKCATAANVAAIIAAAVAPLATTVGLAAAVAPLATTAGLAATAAALPAAITGGGYATTYDLVFGTGGVTLGNVWRSCVTAIGDTTAATAAAVAVAVATKAVGATLLHTSVTIAGAPTSGTVVAAPGLGLTTTVVAVAASCNGAAATVFDLASAAGTTMGVHQILIGDNFTLSLPFGYVLRGGTNASITADKTAGATIVVDVWYWIG